MNSQNDSSMIGHSLHNLDKGVNISKQKLVQQAALINNHSSSRSRQTNMSTNTYKSKNNSERMMVESRRKSDHNRSITMTGQAENYERGDDVEMT